MKNLEKLETKEKPTPWEKNIASEVEKPNKKIEETASLPNKRALTLRNRLMMTVLPTVLVPLAIASAIEINVARGQARENLLRDIENSVFLVSERTQQFLKDAFNETSLLAANSVVIESLESGNQQAQSQGLLEKPIEKLEEQFASDKLLKPNLELNNYLKAIVEKRGLAEIILTQSNGYNIAYSSPTSDFVQNDEQWWQSAAKDGQSVLEPKFDESSNSAVLELVNRITNPNSKELLGVIKLGVSVAALNEVLIKSVGVEVSPSEQIQIIAPEAGKALNTLTAQGGDALGEVIGTDVVIKASQILVSASDNSAQNIVDAVGALNNEIGNVTVSESNSKKLLSFEHQGRLFKLASIPNTNGLVVVASVATAEVAQAGQQVIKVFTLTAIVLGAISALLVALLAKQLSLPLTNLTKKAKQVAEGDLTVKAQLEGTAETLTLADSFNKLVEQVNTLIQEQTALAEESKQQKETLEQGINQLINEVEGALEGDLTVRASLSSMEMSTVADLFNAIIDNLNDIAIQVKQSTGQVSSNLVENEESIQLLAQQAIKETEETRKVLTSVEQMSDSIEKVSDSARQAAALADDTYSTTEQGTKAIGSTVESIVNLRTTVGETAKKMKRLGESSQKISQVVSLIEEIALKTNLLAINASVEASRAGEQGQGFTVVAEQVGALAEQSAAAAKEIAQIVAAIQAETQEVTQAMELGISQVVESTNKVESTKDLLGLVLERSRRINDLMQSISKTTVNQADTSRSVTNIIKELSQQSEEQLQSSQQIAQSMQATAQLAKKLEFAVEQFKVNENN